MTPAAPLAFDALLMAQSAGVRNSREKAAGMFIRGSLSGPPASSNSTLHAGSSDRRAASTQPAEPAPTTT